jgi:small redox-active disulfide protein 2
MFNVKVLGSGCKNCETTYELIQKLAKENNIDINLEKINDVAQIAAYGVMATPAVIVDEQVAHSVGGVPHKDVILSWFQLTGASCCGSCCGN